MPAMKACGVKPTGRKLRIHRKSKQGCGNCKIRQVKCDETKPMCKRCGKYGTFCDYESRYSKMQPWVPGTIDFQSIQPPVCSENKNILCIINTPPHQYQEGSNYLQQQDISIHDLELLHKFNVRTILTLGSTSAMEIYRNAYAKLTYSHPFLLHIVLTLTLMHDKYLGTGSNSTQSQAMAYHWSRGAALLNRKLSDRIDPSERDALWACAGLLGALAISSIPAKSPEEAWPLVPSASSDLDWLKMCQGKKAIWKITDPLRPDSLFHPLMPNFLQTTSHLSPESTNELRVVFPDLIYLCKLDHTASEDSNPYLGSVTFLARTVNVECNIHNMTMFLSFFGTMHPDFRQLLQHKDPCALLLLAYWYVKMCSCHQWWIWRRASLECQAICLYLKHYHGDDRNILNALRYPEMALLSVVEPRF